MAKILKKGVIYMGFGVPSVPAILALFDLYPIGTRLRIGIETGGWWHGAFGGIQDGVALLTNAHFHNNQGVIVIGAPFPAPSIPTIRIPIRQITFVSL